MAFHLVDRSEPRDFRVAALSSLAAGPQEEDWTPLFNGKDLTGWTPKIKGYALGVNHNDTFRVEDGLLKVHERFMKEKGQPRTMADVGAYLHMIKEAEPRFTGRAIKNVTDAIKMRAMDIELPDEWFERPEAFMHKSYDDKKAMIEELRGPFSMDMVMQEINRYADSEFRYSDKSDDAAVLVLVAVAITASPYCG